MWTKQIAQVNAEAFGRKDPYSKPDAIAATRHLIRKDGLRLVAYLLWKDLPEYISIERVGVLKSHRRKGLAQSLYRSLQRLARKANKPIRTYLSYDNLASYKLHVGTGFHPTHIAWNRWVWVEYPVKSKKE